MPIHTLIFGAAIVFLAAELGLQSGRSDIPATLFLGLPIMFLWSFVYLLFLAIAFWRGKGRAKLLLISWVVIIGCAASGWAMTWLPLHRSNIHYQFRQGATGGWQEVQFSMIKDGRVFECPWVGGFPLQVSFPDIDHDGFPDIRVTELAGVGEGGVVEYLYLPKNDGKKYWKFLRNGSGLRVSYPPDGQIYP